MDIRRRTLDGIDQNRINQPDKGPITIRIIFPYLCCGCVVYLMQKVINRQFKAVKPVDCLGDLPLTGNNHFKGDIVADTSLQAIVHLQLMQACNSNGKSFIYRVI